MIRAIVKRAVWTHPERAPLEFLLEQVERACFRWVKPDSATGDRWDGVDYLDCGMALKAMRFHVESDPFCVGVDLTVFDVAPPPERRAAERIDRIFNAGVTGEEYRDRCAQIIAAETNIGPLVQAFSELIAFLMTRRPVLSLGLALSAMPPTVMQQINRAVASSGQQPGRNLAFDGLLYSAIGQLAKSTGQDFDNLLKPLREPISNVVLARGVPKSPDGGGQ